MIMVNTTDWRRCRNIQFEIVEILDLRNAQDNDLLIRFHSLYLSAFPIEQERESIEVWKSLLWHEDSGPPDPKFHLLVVGRYLKDRARREVYGGVTLEYYRQSRCGFIGYLVVAPQYRQRGLARLLMEKVVNTFTQDSLGAGVLLRAVFGETHGPRLIESDEDSMPPVERIGILDRLGARWIDIPYVEPEVNPGRGKPRSMILLVFWIPRQNQDFIECSIVKAFLREFYRCSHGTQNPEEDPDMKMMEESLATDRVPLKSLLCLLR